MLGCDAEGRVLETRDVTREDQDGGPLIALIVYIPEYTS